MKKLIPGLRMKFDRSDIFFTVGGLTICGGVGMIYWPAAVILLGLFILVLALSETKPNKGG